MSGSDQAPCQKVNIAEMRFPPTHIYSIILHPSARLSLLFCYLLHLFPPVPSSPSCFPHALTLSLPHVPPSIHTTASLLIISDLLKYILCHSLLLPLSSLAPSLPRLVFCSATSSHYSFPLHLSEPFEELLSFVSAG